MADFSTPLGALTLRNPLMAASGCFGYGVEYAGALDLASLGAVVVKGLFLSEREGHAPPRIVETPAGMLNAIGLQGIGVHRFVKERLPELRALGAVTVVNVCGVTLDEYCEVSRVLSDHEGVAAIELNISCPNIKEGGIQFGCSLHGTHDVVAAVRKVTTLPIMPKLTPNVTDVASFARAAEDAGADAVSLVNTFLAMAIDVETRKPKLTNVHGWPERPGDPPDRGAHGVRVPAGREDPDRRHGRHRVGRGRARVHARGRQCRPDRHGELRRPVHLVACDRRSRVVLRAPRRDAPGRPGRRGADGQGQGSGAGMSSILIALDVDRIAQADALVQQLAPHVGGFKVGKQLFVSEGPAAVAPIVDRGLRLFLDLKFHDIPNTVAGAVRAGTRLGAWMMTVHASGGHDMLRGRAGCGAGRGSQGGRARDR